MASTWLRGTAVFLLLSSIARLTAAQTTDAAIVGRVVDSAGAPVAGAEIAARDSATGFVTRVVTNDAGRFALLQLPLGGPYAVVARKPGYRPVADGGWTLRLGDRITVDLVLIPTIVELAPLETVAEAGETRGVRIGGNTRIDATQLRELPVVNRNFTDLSTLAPTTGQQQSALGQRWTGTDFRFDGAQAKNLLRGGEYGAGPFTVSLEAVREFEVNTTVYDVTQGRGGATIAAATKSGTNRTVASVFTYYRGDGLAAPTDYLGRSRDVRDFTTIQWGGSVGGPIVRDRLHYFLAFDRQDAREPLFVGLLRTPADEIGAGVSRDSLARMETILRASYGLGTDTQLGRLDRKPIANTGFARLDWSLNDRQRLTLRYTLSAWRYPLSGGVDQPIALLEARSDFRSIEHQALASLRSTLGASAQNELKAGVSWSSRELTPRSNLPRGFVRIRSALPNGSTGDVRVQFGGNRLAPDQSREATIQLIDHLYLQRGDWLVTLGTDNALTRLSTLIAEGQSGLFEFESLADLANGVPSRYTRALPLGGDLTSRQWAVDLATFAQLEWRPSAAISAMGGLRWDGTSFLTRARNNPGIERLFGVRTDRLGRDWMNLQPRAQLVWDRRGDGRDVVRVGGGAFTSQTPYYVQNNSLLNDGFKVTDIDLRGAQIPTPDYPAYRADPSTIPGLPDGVAAPPSFINVIGEDYRLPTTWRASAAYQRRVTDWFTIGASAIVSRLTDGYRYTDLNFVDTPAFTLDNEGGRAVLVPAATIDARGRTNVRNALREPEAGRVMSLVSDGIARQSSLTFEATARFARDGWMQGSVTFNRSRDNTTYGCCLARTSATFTAVASDPRDLSGSYGPSDLDFKRKVVLYASLPSVWGFRLSGRYVGQTGRPFSLVVNGDINGDESTSNDLAFIFDPDDPATDPAVADAMRRLLANDQNIARDYIRANLGRVASRNGAYAPWNSRVDLRLAKSLPAFHGQRIELTMDIFNFANLLSRDWGGQYLLPQGISTQNPYVQRLPLLNVVGFDQTTHRYQYTVNENTGVLQRQGDPYQIQLGARYAF